jgi:hypothetical protein
MKFAHEKNPPLPSASQQSCHEKNACVKRDWSAERLHFVRQSFDPHQYGPRAGFLQKAEPCPTQRVEPSRPHRQMPDRGGNITGRDAYAQQVHTHVFIP